MPQSGEIKVQDMDNGNLRFTISYESSSRSDNDFANAPDGQIFRIEVDATGSGQGALLWSKVRVF